MDAMRLWVRCLRFMTALELETLQVISTIWILAVYIPTNHTRSVNGAMPISSTPASWGDRGATGLGINSVYNKC